MNAHPRYHITNYVILTIYSYDVLLCFVVHVHVHICPLLFLEVTSSIPEMVSTVDGLPVGVMSGSIT
jgi:hypothetical protein